MASQLCRTVSFRRWKALCSHCVVELVCRARGLAASARGDPDFPEYTRCRIACQLLLDGLFSTLGIRMSPFEAAPGVRDVVPVCVARGARLSG